MVLHHIAKVMRDEACSGSQTVNQSSNATTRRTHAELLLQMTWPSVSAAQNRHELCAREVTRGVGLLLPYEPHAPCQVDVAQMMMSISC